MTSKQRLAAIKLTARHLRSLSVNLSLGSIRFRPEADGISARAACREAFKLAADWLDRDLDGLPEAKSILDGEGK